jgi:uncharacterized protein (DUF4415 family)
MAIISSTIKVGQKIPKEILKQARKEYREAMKHPPVFTEDCPESTPEALQEFAEKARELRRQKRLLKPVVALRVMPEVLDAYKALGKGYTGVMAEALRYVADNPDILEKVKG